MSEKKKGLEKYCRENSESPACGCKTQFSEILDNHLNNDIPTWRIGKLDVWSEYDIEKKAYDRAVLRWEQNRLKDEVDLLWQIQSSTATETDRKNENSGSMDDCGPGHTLGGFFRGAPAADSPGMEDARLGEYSWGRCHTHTDKPTTCNSFGPLNDKAASDDGNYTGEPADPGLPPMWSGGDPRGFRTRTDTVNGAYQGYNDEWLTVGSGRRVNTPTINNKKSWAPICKAPGPRPDAREPLHPQQKDKTPPNPEYNRLQKFCRNLVPNIRENYNGKNPCSFENVNKRGGKLFGRDLEDGAACEGEFTGGVDSPNYPKELIHPHTGEITITDCSKIFKFNQIGTTVKGESACPTNNGCTWHRPLDDDEKDDCVFSYGYNFPEQNLRFALQSEGNSTHTSAAAWPNGLGHRAERPHGWKWVVGARNAKEDRLMRARATEQTCASHDRDAAGNCVDRLCGIMVDFPMWDGVNEEVHTKCTKRDYSKPIWHSFSLEGAGWGGKQGGLGAAKSVWETSIAHRDNPVVDIYGRRLNSQRKWRGAGHGREADTQRPDNAGCDSCAQDALDNDDGEFAELSFEGRYNESNAYWGNPDQTAWDGGRKFHDECRHPANYIKETTDNAHKTTESTLRADEKGMVPEQQTEPTGNPTLTDKPTATGSITQVQCCANVIDATHADVSNIEQKCDQAIEAEMNGETPITAETLEEKRNLLENMKKKSKEALNKLKISLNEKFGSKLKDKFGLDEDSNILLYIVLAIIVILIGVGGYLWYRWKKKK